MIQPKLPELRPPRRWAFPAGVAVVALLVVATILTFLRPASDQPPTDVRAPGAGPEAGAEPRKGAEGPSSPAGPNVAVVASAGPGSGSGGIATSTAAPGPPGGGGIATAPSGPPGAGASTGPGGSGRVTPITDQYDDSAKALVRRVGGG